MGQRHQAFLIARVRPHGSAPDGPRHYRCIAAYHHQWCYGRLPLIAVRRFVTLAQNEENAAVIRAEIRTIEGKYGATGADEPCIPEVPCPYAASLLGTAWTTDLEVDPTRGEPYFTGTTLENGMLEAYMGCWEGDNNDGISIIDVTDPASPAYCFAQRDRVLTAEDYVRGYYEEYEPDPRVAAGQSLGGHSDSAWADIVKTDDRKQMVEKDVRAKIEDLAGVRLLTAAALNEAWIYAEFEDDPKSANPPGEDPADVAPRTLAPLADTAFEMAIRHSAETEHFQALEEIVWLPGKAAQAKAILRTISPLPDSSTDFLIGTLAELKELEQPYLDLSDFQLAASQIVRILPRCPHLASLNLSFNSRITAGDLPTLATAAPSLRRLIVMGCAGIADAALLDLVRASPASACGSLEGVLHPALLAIAKPAGFPTRFAMTYADRGRSYHRPFGASLPFFTPAQVVRALPDYLALLFRPPEMMGNMFRATTIPLFAALAGVRAPGVRWGERTVVAVPTECRPAPGVAEHWTFALDAAKEYRWAFRRTTSVPPGEDGGEAEARTDVFDLHGFLRCMEEQGRPMPSPEEVKTLETLLTTPAVLDAWDRRRGESDEMPCRFAGSELEAELEAE